MEIEIIDNSGKVRKEFQAAILSALEKCGKKGEEIAAKLSPVAEYMGGTLRDSITHQVFEGENAVYIGTNVEYAPYVELGTGKYYPGGRPTPWAYQDAKGNWHLTHGQRAQPYLKPAVADHISTYRTIIQDELKG